jgi:hypothetical protein
MVSSLFLVGVILLSSTKAWSELMIDGYLSNFSVVQGGSLNLYTSTNGTDYSVAVYANTVNAQGQPSTVLKAPATTWIKGILQGSPVDMQPVATPDWVSPLPISVDENWPTGIYHIQLIAKDAGSTSRADKKLFFRVKSANPGSKSKIILFDNAPTYTAYNSWGGKSLYASNSVGQKSGTTVSLLRPGQNLASQEELSFSYWAKITGIALEYASMMDLHADPYLLPHYQLAVIVGHSEYWTAEMRHNFDAFIQNGGNALILSGNTMWWQIRIEGSQMVGYKAAATKSDPFMGIDPALVTTNWYKDPVDNPENKSTGVSFRNGGYVNWKDHLPAAEGHGGYTVTNAAHWIYEMTGLANADVFGQSSTIVGYEVDGCTFVEVQGNLVPTGQDGTPTNFEILAFAQAVNLTKKDHVGFATMGIFQPFSNGGYVFNAATVDWADGLWYWGDASRPRGSMDPVVDQITQNIITRLGIASPTTTTTTTVVTTTALSSTTTTIPGSAQVTLALDPGWNLLSSSIGFQVATLFDNGGKFASAWKWTDDGTGHQTWAVYLPNWAGAGSYAESHGFVPLTSISSGEGFWLNSKVKQEVTVSGTPVHGQLSFSSGWNLAGLKGTKPVVVADLGPVISVWKWTKVNNSKTWAVSLPGSAVKGAEYCAAKGFGQITTILPGEGFWVNKP